MTRNLPYDRAERVADIIYRIVAECLLTELTDPRLKDVEITRVSMTRDLKIARIYFYLGDASDKRCKEVQSGFRSAGGYLKRKIGRELELKYTPEMEFFYDDSIELREKIEGLFESKSEGE